ncbi:dTDP-4-amino-4,6-dideoxygalactose transaminase [Lacisediminihabitans changchengi]|uniref:dTDP-4-amino-4,6-dideoxygalactose transaminase n=1 Tax=Lacisediminihabitans changchengi TaxID=2787634 RepID=A0A934SJH0_9MICO|nr:dTDP-4-amino-4,6-dideoxygalactose transaminase [Lacisediminihabitans changchengi]MBK4346421.1 dTDP-4-amino-4,6-dideoxygalactose transaminase [Lacisediminihabitans changchengi]
MARKSVASAVDVIPFSRPYRSSAELTNLETVLGSGHVHGDGDFTRSATARLSRLTGSENVLLTTSATHALEMASSLLDIGPGDEVVMPSFTFPSAADAVARTGATCVFVDIDPATGNIDPADVAEAVGPLTAAISIMHYGGVPVDVASIQSIAVEHGLPIIEDNAHGLGVQGLGTAGVLAAQSFHDTKNVHCGEGGALLINDPSMVARAEIMREKGTNRSQFLRGQVDKYSWMDWGSSYLPSELNAAVLDSQLADFGEIQLLRTAVWNRYSTELAEWAAESGVQLMDPPGGIHASHLFFVIMPTWGDQTAFIAHLRSQGVQAAFHYVPLDTSPAGQRYGRTLRELERSADFSRRLVRLPLWAGMGDDEVGRVIAAVLDYRVGL